MTGDDRYGDVRDSPGAHQGPGGFHTTYVGLTPEQIKIANRDERTRTLYGALAASRERMSDDESRHFVSRFELVPGRHRELQLREKYNIKDDEAIIAFIKTGAFRLDGFVFTDLGVHSRGLTHRTDFESYESFAINDARELTRRVKQTGVLDAELDLNNLFDLWFGSFAHLAHAAIQALRACVVALGGMKH